LTDLSLSARFSRSVGDGEVCLEQDVKHPAKYVDTIGTKLNRNLYTFGRVTGIFMTPPCKKNNAEITNPVFLPGIVDRKQVSLIWLVKNLTLIVVPGTEIAKTVTVIAIP
jgi:hypothetical protein